MKSSNNQKGLAPIVIVFIVAGILILGGGVWYAANKFNANKRIACTQEAKRCPDGSYVGRAGPSCEFTPCSNVFNSTDTINRIGATSTINTSGRDGNQFGKAD